MAAGAYLNAKPTVSAFDPGADHLVGIVGGNVRRVGIEAAGVSYSVPTLAALKALTTRPALVSMLGSASAGDGEHGDFRWHAGATDTPDDVLVVQPTSGAAGRYKRLPFIAIGTGATARTWQSKARDALNVEDFGLDASDAGPAINRAITAAKTGQIITLRPDTNPYTIQTPVAVNKRVVLDFGKVPLVVSGAIDAFTFSADDAEGRGIYLTGDRTTNQRGYIVTAGYGVVLDRSYGFLLDTGIYQSNGYGHVYQSCRFRNLKFAVAHCADGVGPRLIDLKYDTDTGSYAQPTAGGIVLSCEGAQAWGCDMIRSGTGLLVDVPAGRDVEWLMLNNCFFDSPGTYAALLRNNQASRYMRGIFFDQCWFATSGGIGVLGDGSGTGEMDGIFFTDCVFHNNDDEAVRIAYGPATAIEFCDCKFHGNSVGGTAANVYVNNTGVVRFKGCDFGRAMRWASTPMYHLYLDNSHGSVFIDDACTFDANVATAKIQDGAPANTVYGRPNRDLGLTSWEDIGTITGAGASSYTLAIPAGYSELFLYIDGLTQSSAGDPQFGFSVDAGSGYLDFAQEQAQFNAASENRKAYVDGGRGGTNALQGTMHVVGPPSCFKHVTYNSNEDGAAGQGLLVIGTLESTSEINLVRVAASAGNLSAGTVKIVGKR